MWRLFPIVGLLALGLACQAPFGRDRHDLVGDRVAAIATAPGDAVFTASPVLVVDGALYAADARPTVTWTPDDGGDALAGYPVALPVGPTSWAIDVDFPSGEAWSARLTVPAMGVAALDAPAVSVGLLDLSTTEATEDELTVDARAALDATPTDAVPVDRWARLSASWPEGAPTHLDRVRWMATDAATTFLELDETTADWATATITLDDLEIDDSTPSPAGVVTVLALALDGAGANAVTPRDVDVDAGRRLARVGGRLLAIDVDLPPGARVRATLTADPTLPAGLALTGARLADALLDATLPCQAPEPTDPFDPNALLLGRCTLADVDGADVVVVLE